MKIKTLLIATAALAVGVISSQAQVYSANIVGYANTVIPGNFKLSLLVNPFLGNNNTNGATQCLPGLIGGESLYIWHNNFYYVYNYAGAGVGTSIGYASDWYDGNHGTAAQIPGDSNLDTTNLVYWTPAPQIPQGTGFYILNPGADLTNTFAGTVVLQNTNAPVSLPGSFALTLAGSTPAIGGNLSGTNFNLPFVGGESVYTWNQAGGFYYIYNYAGAGVGTSIGYASDWYDGNHGTAAQIPGDSNLDTTNLVYWTQPLNVNVGQGFFILNPGSSLTWTQNMIVQ